MSLPVFAGVGVTVALLLLSVNSIATIFYRRHKKARTRRALFQSDAISGGGNKKPRSVAGLICGRGLSALA